MKDNKTLMQEAKHALQGKWKIAIGTFFIYMLIQGTISALKSFGSILSLIISGPLMTGYAQFSLNLARNEEALFEQAFEGIKNDFKRSFYTYIRMILIVLLYMLLLIVPGIIKSISYSMTFFILAENKEISPKEALEESKQMMEGYKLKMFYLGLRFFLLFLLCILTLGIGFLWLTPYVNVTIAKFYDDIKNKA